MNKFVLATLILAVPTLAIANPVMVDNGGSPAQAQVYGDGSAAAAARSTSNANAVAHQTQHQTATGGSARATGGKGGNVSIGSVGNNGGSNGGGLGLTVPGGYGNASCGGGVGLGGLGLSGGGSGGGTLWEFGDCKRMRESAALRDLGYPDAALAELCQIDRVREAFGGKCPKPSLIIDTNAGDNDYCFTRNAGDVNQHRECDRIKVVR